MTATLATRSDDVVAVDLPVDDDSAGLAEYTDAVVDAIGDRREVVLVAQSLGGFTAPEDDDPETMLLHDVPVDVAAESATHVRQQSGTPFEKPWPLSAWPDVPTRFLLCRDDRLFPADFQRRVVRERLGIAPDEIDGGHLPALARPAELATRLLDYVDALA